MTKYTKEPCKYPVLLTFRAKALRGLAAAEGAFVAEGVLASAAREELARRGRNRQVRLAAWQARQVRQ